MATLKVQLEQLSHTAYFSRPLTELWGDGRSILSGLYDSFHAFGATLAGVRVEGGNPGDQVVSVAVDASTTHRFRFDRVETTFFGFSEESFAKTPAVLEASLGWIRAAIPEASVTAHQFTHFTHSKLVGESLRDFLGRVGPKGPERGGESTGHGAIFHWNIKDRNWATQLTVDKSMAFEDGLFVMLSLTVSADKINFGQVASDGREYLLGLLQELGLEFSQD